MTMVFHVPGVSVRALEGCVDDREIERIRAVVRSEIDALILDLATVVFYGLGDLERRAQVSGESESSREARARLLDWAVDLTNLIDLRRTGSIGAVRLDDVAGGDCSSAGTEAEADAEAEAPGRRVNGRVVAEAAKRQRFAVVRDVDGVVRRLEPVECRGGEWS